MVCLNNNAHKGCAVNKMVPLGELLPNETAQVVEFRLLGEPHERAFLLEFQKRAERMGLRIGKNVRILKNEDRGPVVIALNGSRLAMGRSIAQTVMVKK